MSAPTSLICSFSITETIPFFPFHCSDSPWGVCVFSLFARRFLSVIGEKRGATPDDLIFVSNKSNKSSKSHSIPRSVQSCGVWSKIGRSSLRTDREQQVEKVVPLSKRCASRSEFCLAATNAKRSDELSWEWEEFRLSFCYSVYSFYFIVFRETFYIKKKEFRISSWSIRTSSCQHRRPRYGDGVSHIRRCTRLRKHCTCQVANHHRVLPFNDGERCSTLN